MAGLSLENFQERLQAWDALVDKHVLSKYPQAKALHEKIKVRPSYIILGVCAFVLLFVLFGVGANPLCNLVGFIYPLYASFKALKTEDKEDDSMWLTYWIVYGFFTLVESFSDFLLYWVPFYHMIKIGFLVWCMHPSFRGANKIYKNVIEPFLDTHLKDIDQSFSTGTPGASKTAARDHTE